MTEHSSQYIDAKIMACRLHNRGASDISAPIASETAMGVLNKTAVCASSTKTAIINAYRLKNLETK